MIAVIDYDAGNMASVVKALKFIGEDPVITRDPEEILKADKVILPGVGAYADAMEKLNSYGLVDVIKEYVASGKPFFGICLGLQLLFDESEEGGEHVAGLGILPGKVKLFPKTEGLKIPHMGWNSLKLKGGHPLFSRIKDGTYVYFVHSYHAVNCGESVIAETEYGIPVTAAAASANVMGCQFHPEKSGDAGLDILRAFVTMKEGDL